MEEVENADAGEGFGHDVCEDRGGGARVHGAELGVDVIELGQGVDGHEGVADVEAVAVPEDHPGADADVTQGVKGYVVDHCV